MNLSPILIKSPSRNIWSSSIKTIRLKNKSIFEDKSLKITWLNFEKLLRHANLVELQNIQIGPKNKGKILEENCPKKPLKKINKQAWKEPH